MAKAALTSFAAFNAHRNFAGLFTSQRRSRTEYLIPTEENYSAS